MAFLGVAFGGLYSHKASALSLYSFGLLAALLIFTMFTLQSKILHILFAALYGLMALYTAAFALMAIADTPNNQPIFGLLLMGALGLILLSASLFFSIPSKRAKSTDA